MPRRPTPSNAMKRRKRKSSCARASLRVGMAIVATAWFALPTNQSFAAPITTPTDLLPGAQYRLAFLTTGTRNAASTDITDYDAFVTAEANSVPELSSLSTTWQVLGSTATVDARDHTGTDPFGPGVPIYRLDDIRLADDYADLWDGNLDAPLEVDQNGVVPGIFPVYTGSGIPGIASYPLGGATVTVGVSFATSPAWVEDAFATEPSVTVLPFYALSAVLTVPVPEAGTLPMLTLALAALLLVRRVRAS